jgi:hypothetical protein
MAKTERKIVFMGWRESVPEKRIDRLQVTEHDLLRMVLLAEDSGGLKW